MLKEFNSHKLSPIVIDSLKPVLESVFKEFSQQHSSFDATRKEQIVEDLDFLIKNLEQKVGFEREEIQKHYNRLTMM